jgi:hypothetical protein
VTLRLVARHRPRAAIDGAVGHLVRLSDDVALFEHADGAVPRPDHGHCVDDNARAFVVLARQPSLDRAQRGLLDRCLRVVLDAQAPDGRFHNRMGHPDHRWLDGPGTGDWWGHALWALGVAAAGHPDRRAAARARAAFVAGARHRSPHPRAMASAALGAAALVEHSSSGRDAAVAAALLVDAVAVIGRPAAGPWTWPAPRLTYANGRLPEALIAAGHALGDRRALADGLALLAWLAGMERRDAIMSFTPVRGRAVGDAGPAFDQQPIEAWALAGAARRAFLATADAAWCDVVLRCQRWFEGANDVRTPLHDAVTGGGHDGLTAAGRNGNQGAESTLALIATAQDAVRLGFRAPTRLR